MTDEPWHSPSAFTFVYVCLMFHVANRGYVKDKDCQSYNCFPRIIEVRYFDQVNAKYYYSLGFPSFDLRIYDIFKSNKSCTKKLSNYILNHGVANYMGKNHPPSLHFYCPQPKRLICFYGAVSDIIYVSSTPAVRKCLSYKWIKWMRL